jgi:hypothetical protein
MSARQLLHRWFVEYNPLYILSAALVLRGVNLISGALVGAGHVYAQLAVPAVVELYAWTLIGGAALLFRIGLRRPAVMLALLAVVYQGDLTLHTETCAFLGGAGLFASLVWGASFVLKLFALARAMRLRVSASAFAVPVFGALGLVLVPRMVQHASAHAGSMLAAAWLFALFAASLWTKRQIDHEHALDDWGLTVMRRTRLATWSIWGALAVVHVLFLFSQRAMDASALLPLPLLLATRFMRRELFVWASALGALVLVRAIAPQFLAFTSLLCAIILVLRAARDVTTRARVAPLAVGALFCVHLCVWTAGFSGGALPPHLLPLDAALGLAVALAAWKLQVRAALAPFAMLVTHHMIQTRIVTAPITSLEWGVWTASFGFILLLATIFATIRIHKLTEAPPE